MTPVTIIGDILVGEIVAYSCKKVGDSIKEIFIGKEDYNQISEKYKSEISISDLIFIKKIFYFNKGYGDLNEKIEFLANSRKNWNSKVENLLLVINGMNDLKKIEIVGKVFKLFLYEELSKSEYIEIIHILEMMLLEDILELKRMYEEKEIEDISFQNLVPNILHKGSAFGVVKPKYTHGNHYIVTDIGKKLFESDIL